MDRLDVNSKPFETAELKTEEQRQKWLECLIDDMHHWRRKCDVIIPDQSEATVKAQQRASWAFLQKQGKVIGAISAMKVCGLISDRCFQEMNQKAANTLIPTIVGEKRG